MKSDSRDPRAESGQQKMMKVSANCREWRAAIRFRVCETFAKEEETQLEAHLASCVQCRRYSAELHATAAGLSWLGSREVKPSVGLRARWTSAVEDAATPATLSGALGAWAEWLRVWLSRNRRPASAVAGLWLLTLLFRVSAPEAARPSRTVLACSPIQIVRLLKADQQLLAWHFWKQSPAPATEHRRPPARPRSSLSPVRPTAGFTQEAEST